MLQFELHDTSSTLALGTSLYHPRLSGDCIDITRTDLSAIREVDDDNRSQKPGVSNMVTVRIDLSEHCVYQHVN